MDASEIAEGSVLAARFRLHLRCEHCVAESKMVLDVPEADEAPTDIEALLDSAFLQRQKFVCPKCDNPIGLIAGVLQLKVPEIDHA